MNKKPKTPKTVQDSAQERPAELTSASPAPFSALSAIPPRIRPATPSFFSPLGVESGEMPEPALGGAVIDHRAG